MMLLTEEVGELAEAIRKSRGTRWGHEGEIAASEEAISDELGDVLFLLEDWHYFLGLIWMTQRRLCSIRCNVDWADLIDRAARRKPWTSGSATRRWWT
jgi:hypothetical protein